MLNLDGIDNPHAAFIVKRLADLRSEMEQWMPGGKLRKLPALIIFDVCNALGLTPEERVTVLGPQNEARVERLINSPVSMVQADPR